MTTGVTWFLLFYMIAALIWWFISLEKQSKQMSALKMELAIQQVVTPAQLTEAQQRIQTDLHTHQIKFIGEGISFLAVLLAGGVFIIRSIRKQFRLQQQQQDFMMAVTHELKTPIAVTKLNLETLQKHQLDEVKRKKIIEKTIEETNRLNGLTNNILLSSQLDSANFSLTKEELNFSDLVRTNINDYRQRFPNRSWEMDIEEEIELEGDGLLLTILLNNLLDNAMKYTPADQPIECRLYRKEATIELQVLDQGPGIPAAERNHIFEKFYRIGNESTRTTKGTGLGLFLCKKIAQDHHATIRVSDNQPKGCIFTVRFKMKTS